MAACPPQEKYGPVGVVHIDAHCDVNEHGNNCKVYHGTTFYRALEENLIDPKRMVQIGIRGSGHSVEDLEWPLSKVITLLWGFWLSFITLGLN